MKKQKYRYYKVGVETPEEYTLYAYAIKAKHNDKAGDIIAKHLRDCGVKYDDAFVPAHECEKDDIYEGTPFFYDTIFGLMQIVWW